MKRLHAIALLGLAANLSSAFGGSLPPPTVALSPNGRYKFVYSHGGCCESLWDGPTEVWKRYTNHVFYRAAVSDQGDLVMCEWGRDWILYGKDFQELAHPGDTPIRFDIDPPRTCWVSGGNYYAELSQGEVYQVRNNQWIRVDGPSNIPEAILQHQRASVSDSQIQSFLKGDSVSNFSNLTAQQLQSLQREVKKGNGRAALALALGGRRGAREQMLQIAKAGKYPHHWEAKEAIVLLDGQAAAKELVSTLTSEPGGALAELYTRVRCPEVVPKMLPYIGLGQFNARRILIFQTGVDLGYDQLAWKRWYAHRDPAVLEEFLDPSIALRKAQRRERGWLQSLVHRPRLVGLFPAGIGNHEKVVLLPDRLVRVSGDTVQRGLEWDIQDGHELKSLPETVPSVAFGNFAWHQAADYLWYHTNNEEGVWQGPRLIFRHNSGRAEGSRPAWLPDNFYPHSFEADTLEGYEGSHDVRYRLSDGSREIVHRQAYQAVSPDGHYSLDNFLPFELTDTRTGRVTRREDLRKEAACYSPDGRLIAAGMFDEVTLLDGANLKVVQTFLTPGWGCRTIFFDATGRHLVVQSYRAVCIYDLKPEPPAASANPVQVAESWTGFRLKNGFPRPLTPEEFWRRR